MNRKLYVGNLGFDVTEEEVKTLFSDHGEVTEVKMISDRETGRSRGFAFVTMSSPDEATGALDALNGQLFRDRKLVIDEARTEQRDGRGGAGAGRPSFNRSGGGRDRGYN